MAIVGAGIMGLAHAYQAAKEGLSVVIFERNPTAKGATIRNFGMLAIIAQAAGTELESANYTLSCWQEIAAEAGIAMHQAGCLFLARDEMEMSVLEEFCSSDNCLSGN